MPDPETGTAGLVALVVMDGQQDEHGQVTAGGTSAHWMVPEGQIEYLKDQLHRLFGEPVVEVLLPAIAQQVIDGMVTMDSQWPGVVKLTRDEGGSA